MLRTALPLLAACPILTAAISFDVNDEASVKTAAKTISKDVLSYYEGNQLGQTPGLFSLPYYWWESGAVWGSLIDYWAYTGDDQYNDLIQQALTFQTGPDSNFMPPNQTATEGNDDQAAWALAAINAAEKDFPAEDGSPSWIDLAKAVFDEQVARWDTTTCGGGLRWQIFKFNKGYDYKNSQSNGFFFQLAARLAAFTGNQTYVDWAEKSYQWSKDIGFINKDFEVYDGTPTQDDCSDISKIQWTYVAATYVYGSAVLYNHTSNSTWQDTTNSLLDATKVFFKNNIMTEVACESQKTCNYDQFAFKGLASQWLGNTMRIAPYTSDYLSQKLQSSAAAAAKQCSGEKNGTTCGSTWVKSKYDGKTGLGQELSAMNAVLATFAGKSAANAKTTTNAASTASSSANGQSSSSTSTPASPSSQPASGAVRSGGSAVLGGLGMAALCFLML